MELVGSGTKIIIPDADHATNFGSDLIRLRIRLDSAPDPQHWDSINFVNIEPVGLFTNTYKPITLSGQSNLVFLSIEGKGERYIELQTKKIFNDKNHFNVEYIQFT